MGSLLRIFRVSLKNWTHAEMPIDLTVHLANYPDENRQVYCSPFYVIMTYILCNLSRYMCVSVYKFLNKICKNYLMMNSSNNCGLIAAFQFTANHSKIAIVVHYIFVQCFC